LKAGNRHVLHSDRVWAIASFVLFLGIAWVTFGRIFEIRPLDGDNLYILSWSERTPVSGLLQADPNIYPEWRPLAFLTVWLQYQWWNIESIAPYFAANLVVWTIAAWLVSRVVDAFVDSRIAAFVAGAVVLTDARAVKAMVWIVDRQMTLACVFGMLALVVVIRRGDLRMTGIEGIGLFLLLLAAALSKEYGLAFAAALGLYALGAHRGDIAAAAFSAVVAYLGVRLYLVNGAHGYCADSGYFFTMREVCYGELKPLQMQQAFYNVAATAVGSLLHGLFDTYGVLTLAPLLLARSVVKVAVGLTGWLRAPKLTHIAVLVIASNAILSFVFYRERNHLAAVCALGLVIGAGLAVIDARLRTFTTGVRVGVAVVLLSVLGLQAARTRGIVSREVDNLLGGDPCSGVGHARSSEREFARRIKLKYDMSNADCVNVPDGRPEVEDGA
jgi:hypothetical protein